MTVKEFLEKLLPVINDGSKDFSPRGNFNEGITFYNTITALYEKSQAYLVSVTLEDSGYNLDYVNLEVTEERYNEIKARIGEIEEWFYTFSEDIKYELPISLWERKIYSSVKSFPEENMDVLKWLRELNFTIDYLLSVRHISELIRPLLVLEEVEEVRTLTTMIWRWE